VSSTRHRRVVVRMCVGCRTRRETSAMIRVARRGCDVVVGEPTGRGAWICLDSPRCVEEALRGGRLSKALRMPISPARLAGLKDSLRLQGQAQYRKQKDSDDVGVGSI
jgi:predicted RNA-binding protein YlxR (DUF448 family)